MMSKINWKVIKKYKESEKLKDKKIYNNIIWSLKDMNILSYTSSGAYWIIGNNYVTFHPKTEDGDPLYFPSKKYANEYLKEVLSDLEDFLKVERVPMGVY